MTIARSRQVDAQTTPYYHIIGRLFTGIYVMYAGFAWSKNLSLAQNPRSTTDFVQRRAWLSPKNREFRQNCTKSNRLHQINPNRTLSQPN